MLHRLATVALGPVLLAQGRWVRRTVPRLPEPAGPRTGSLGEGPDLRLLVLGDSAAAGVGAGTQQQALAGELARALASRYRVARDLAAKTGATTESTLRKLQRLSGRSYDVVVTSLGVNDVVAAVSVTDWSGRQSRLREELRCSLGARHIIVSGLPPVSGFPALPQPLRWYLGRRARQFDAALAADVAEEQDVTLVALDFATDTSLMALDGFHPGPGIYSMWARRIAACIETDGSA